MTANVIPFPPKKPIIFIDPVEDDGGAWGIFHQRIGHVPRKVAWHIAYVTAETEARQIAVSLGAVFLDDTAPEPKGAA